MLSKLIKSYTLSRPLLLVVTLIFTVLTSGEAAAETPEQALRTLLESKSIDRDNTAIYIWDLEADYQIVSHRATLPITPASVMKCVSVAALRWALPYNYSLQTQVFIDGSVKDGNLRGNIVVVGAGDPSLGDGRHKNQPDFIEEITEALKKRGIRHIEGNITVDDSFFAGPAVHPSWPDADLAQSYGTGCHAFNFAGNASGKKAVTNPSNVFKKQLASALESAGISFAENAGVKPSGKRQQILAYSSPSLASLMRSCMYRSDNLYAESFLRLFGRNNGTDGSTAASARVAMQHWDALNYPTDAIEIADGSGLSRDNRLSAEFLGLILRDLKDDPEYVAFFPLAGEEGTVSNFMKGTPLQGYMALKTGSMNGIQSYAGYVLDGDFQPTHVVVVMTNGLKNRAEFRTALTKFFLSLFR